jgi:hypothetical protein
LTIDDDSVLQASRTTSIGEIKVVCRYFENLGMEKRIFGGEGAFGSSKKIHEKAKKGLSECIKWVKTHSSVTFSPLNIFS